MIVARKNAVNLQLPTTTTTPRFARQRDLAFASGVAHGRGASVMQWAGLRNGVPKRAGGPALVRRQPPQMR